MSEGMGDGRETGEGGLLGTLEVYGVVVCKEVLFEEVWANAGNVGGGRGVWGFLCHGTGGIG